MQPQDRPNTDMALIVEQGLTHDLLHGSVVAWKFLAAHHVPDTVILRVLADPATRRGAGTTAPSATEGPARNPPQHE